MNIEFAKSFFLWSLILNYSVLLVWFFAIVIGKDWVFNFHGRWFPMPKEKFAQVHYLLMGVYKMGILFFNLVPYLVFQLMG